MVAPGSTPALRQRRPKSTADQLEAGRSRASVKAERRPCDRGLADHAGRSFTLMGRLCLYRAPGRDPADTAMRRQPKSHELVCWDGRELVPMGHGRLGRDPADTRRGVSRTAINRVGPPGFEPGASSLSGMRGHGPDLGVRAKWLPTTCFAPWPPWQSWVFAPVVWTECGHSRATFWPAADADRDPSPTFLS